MKNLWLLWLVLLGCARFAPAQTPVMYTSFNKQALTLYEWPGSKIAFLTASSQLDAGTMTALVTTFDGVHAFYASVTGRLPTPYAPTYLGGRSTVAQVPATCGAGCGYLGFTGIELQTTYFATLYDSVRLHHHYDQALFYEFGRNFWFYGPQLEYKGADDHGAVTTGYAVFMRFMAMDSVGVRPAAFGSVPFTYFRSEVEGLLTRYLADPAATWATTLQVGQAPANPLRLGATDLMASFLFRLRADYGGNAFLRRFWRQVGLRPAATTTQGAVDNFVLAASAAAHTNLTCRFLRWRWPVSAAAQQAAQTSYGSCLTATAVAAPSPEGLRVFPNPAHGTVTVTLQVAAGTARQPFVLLDALGRDVRYYPTPTGAEATLDVRGLPAGLYVLRGAGFRQKLMVE